MSGVVCGFPPFFRSDSRVLVLGSFPSVKSRAQSFYYGNPRNAFYGVLAEFFGEPVPKTVEEKKAFLARNGVALWDIVTECEIVASRDDTIKNYKVAELDKVIENAPIRAVLINGGTAYRIFKKHYPDFPVKCYPLPSTSPANTRLDKEEWYGALRAAFDRA